MSLSSNFFDTNMHFSTIILATAAFSTAIAAPSAIPEAIPELEARVPTCLAHAQLKKSGCAPDQNGHFACSADHRAVVSLPLILFVIEIVSHERESNHSHCRGD